MEEEAKIRIGLDSSKFEEGLRKTDSTLKQFGEKAAGGFKAVKESLEKVHGAFHKVVDGIKEQSPALAAAIKIAFSPISGTLLASISVFKAVHGALDEMHRRYDSFGEAAAKTTGNIKDAVEKANETIREQNKKFNEWIQSHQHAGDKITEGLEAQLDVLKQQQTVLDNILAREKERIVQRIHEDVRSGKMTKEQGALAEQHIDATAGQFKSINDLRALRQEIAMRTAANAALGGQRDAAGRDIAQTAGQQRIGQVRLAGYPDKLKKLEETLAIYENLLASAQGKDNPTLRIPLFGTTFRGRTNEEITGTVDDAKVMVERTKAAIERTRASQTRDTRHAADLAERLAKGQGNFDQLDSLIGANAKAITRGRLHEGELMSGMDPAAAQATFAQSAYAKFAAERQKLFLQYQERWDPRTGKVSSTWGLPLEQQGARGADFSKALSGLTREYMMEMQQGRADIARVTKEQGEDLKAIRKFLETFFHASE
jgi:hypothetical protein